ncbi:Uncharacterised protein [Mycobacteroides abscessus subsp. abscessus]|nr:Uncharacterised protein [Mycobacteroides abscessus subsp. abscessus]
MLARSLAQIDHVVAVGLQRLHLGDGGARETCPPRACGGELGGQLCDVGIGVVERRSQARLGVGVAAFGDPGPCPTPLPGADHVTQTCVPRGIVGSCGQRRVELRCLTAQPQSEQVERGLVVQFVTRRREGASRRPDRLRVGVGQCGDKRITFGRRSPLDFRRQPIGVVGQFLLGEVRVVGGSDERTLVGNLRHLRDAARARTAGADVLELANQLVACRQQIRYPGELRVEAHELAELL